MSYFVKNLFSCAALLYIGLHKAETAQPNLANQFFNLPLSFEANQGQADAAVKYLSRGPGFVFYFKDDGIALSSDLKFQFVGANPSPTVVGIEEQAYKSHYLIGHNPDRWHTDISNFAKISYKNLYKGIDALFYGNPQQLEYDLIVAPGACIEAIRVKIEGVLELCLNPQGDLHIRAQSEELRMPKPLIYQVINGEKRSVNGNYLLLAQNEIGFALESYDRNHALIIDPVLVYSTYLGGGEDDFGLGIAVDSKGSAYVVGRTGSANFPTQDSFQPTLQGSANAFITKFNPEGTALIYSTYLGGTGTDGAAGIAIDVQGHAFITGTTSSTDFPTTSGAFQTIYPGGDRSGFVAKLTPSGNALVYSTYIGGSNSDASNAIAVDPLSCAYITGETQSSNFPTTSGAFQTALGGYYDCFVTKLNPTGTKLIYSTYLGGTDADQGFGIALDIHGQAYVAGITNSLNFPTANAFQTSLAGSSDAFVAKFNKKGTGLIFSTYLGGSDQDSAFGIAIDRVGNGYVIGQTSSSDFPVKQAFQATLGGETDVFVSKFSPKGSLIYSTYLGGSNDDFGQGIAVDRLGAAYVTGLTASANFPTQNPLQPTLTGSLNAFVAKFTPSGEALEFSTYLGGFALDQGVAVALDKTGNAYITGNTSSLNFPTQNPFQANLAGRSNAFVTKMQVK